MKNLLIRAVSGALYVAIILVLCFNGPIGVLFLSTFMGVAALIEWTQMLNAGRRANMSITFSVGIFIAILWSRTGVFELSGSTIASFNFLIVLFFAFLLSLQLFSKREDVPKLLYHNFFGLFYIGFPLFLIIRIPYYEGVFNGWLLASIFILIWSLDTFAYLVGSRFGKRPLFKRVSPNKSWEGFAGGAFFTIVAAIVLHHFFPTLSLPGWIGLATVVILAATLGDLFESGIKRAFKLKDSGNFMPGHGGILDRIDSLLFALPIAYYYLRFIEKISL